MRSSSGWRLSYADETLDWLADTPPTTPRNSASVSSATWSRIGREPAPRKRRDAEGQVIS